MKKIIIVGIILTITSIGSYKYLTNNEEVTNEITENTNMLTMMLETEAGTGNYEETTASEWPTDGYVFNEALSKCENGGTLTWNAENKQVEMKSNKSDKCYVYFDKYLRAKINNVTISNVTNNSITLTVDTVVGANPIVKYYYSKDNGNSYIESTSNNYTFNDLMTGTTYEFKIYVVDSINYNSEVFSLNSETLSCINYLEVGTKLENVTDVFNGQSDGWVRPTFKTEGFVYGGDYYRGYLTSFKFSDIKEIKESYYTLNNSVGKIYSYEMGTEYALYNDYLILRSSTSTSDYFYSYKLDMGNNYCDLCINGYAFGNDKPSVLDCSDENWWKKYDDIE